jgi:hypothetical protein
VIEVCLPVARAVLHSNPSAGRIPVAAAAAWFVLVALADVVVVATGEWRYLDALGAAMLAGVLFQSIAATLGYLAPLLRAGARASQDAVRGRLERFASLRAVGWNLGVALVAIAAAVRLEAGPWLARTGWALVVAAALALAVAVSLPVGSAESER